MGVKKRFVSKVHKRKFGGDRRGRGERRGPDVVPVNFGSTTSLRVGLRANVCEQREGRGGAGGLEKMRRTLERFRTCES